MIVVSDTSPLNYLVLIGHVEILPTLFGRVLVPPAVMAELQQSGTPEPVRRWAGMPPGWLETRAGTASTRVFDWDRARRKRSVSRGN